jgi:hypothetical protein
MNGGVRGIFVGSNFTAKSDISGKLPHDWVDDETGEIDLTHKSRSPAPRKSLRGPSSSGQARTG